VEGILAAPLRVLNVDDNDSARYVKSRMLRSAGFDVLDAATGSEAMELLRRARPHVALLDVKLPDISGYELCRLIKSDAQLAGTPVIQISAVYLSESDAAAGLAHGADIYLRFPIDAAVLTAVVQTVARLGRVRETILDRMSDAYFAFDREWRFVSLNRKACEQMRRLGKDPAALIGKVLWDEFEHVVNATSLRRAMDARIALTEENYYEPLGEWFENHVYPTDDGGVAIFQRVITDRKRSEDSVRISHELSQSMTGSMAMGELMGTLAHHVNQPLGAVVVNAYAALKWLKAPTPQVDEVRTALENIARDAHRAAELVRRMQAVMPRELRANVRFNAGQLILDVLPLLHDAARENRTTIELDLEPDLPQVQGDPSQLQQVVLYLAQNATEAMNAVGERARVLRISTARTGSGGVSFSFKDCGPGFDPVMAEKIFEPLYSSKPGNLGMGLAIGRTIIEAHGGRLTVTENSSAGATFQFTLPVVATAVPQEAANISTTSGAR
jgi:signal transduction histidine kinase